MADNELDLDMAEELDLSSLGESAAPLATLDLGTAELQPTLWMRDKQKHLEEMRAERTQATLNSQGGLGYEMARALPTLEAIQEVHQGLREIVWATYARGHQQVGGLLEAVTGGLERAVFERFGSEGLTTLKASPDDASKP